MGCLGVVLGVFLGWILCQVFTWAEVHYSLIPTSVYKLDRIDLNIRFIDLLTITVSTLLICLLATLAPAMRGSQLSVIEGIRHE
jgi:lipoprotein-releasing system permease protein